MARDFLFKKILSVPAGAEPKPPDIAPAPKQSEAERFLNALNCEPVVADGRQKLKKLYNDSAVPGEIKQWSIWISADGYTVTTEWGRMGTHLRRTPKKLRTRTEAADYYNVTIATKRKAGYRDKI